MKCPGHLLKNETFWLDAYSDWALSQTWPLIKNIKKIIIIIIIIIIIKKFQTSKSFTKIYKFPRKFLSKLTAKTLLLLLFKLAPVLTGRFNRSQG